MSWWHGINDFQDAVLLLMFGGGIAALICYALFLVPWPRVWCALGIHSHGFIDPINAIRALSHKDFVMVCKKCGKVVCKRPIK